MSAKAQRAGQVSRKPRGPVATAVLAVLLKDGPGIGYDLAGRITRLMGPSWAFEDKQIYCVLESLEKAGLIFRDEGKVYYPTEDAERALGALQAETPSLEHFRSEIQVRLMFSRETDAPKLVRMLQECRAEIAQMMQDNAVGHSEIETWNALMLRSVRARTERRAVADLAWIDQLIRDIQSRAGGQ